EIDRVVERGRRDDSRANALQPRTAGRGAAGARSHRPRQSRPSRRRRITRPDPANPSGEQPRPLRGRPRRGAAPTMRCPKCHYLSFEPEPRCRNCGFDLAMPEADLAIKPADEAPVPLADLALR